VLDCVRSVFTLFSLFPDEVLDRVFVFSVFSLILFFTVVALFSAL
jgi:hypothetical protein